VENFDLNEGGAKCPRCDSTEFTAIFDDIEVEVEDGKIVEISGCSGLRSADVTCKECDFNAKGLFFIQGGWSEMQFRNMLTQRMTTISEDDLAAIGKIVFDIEFVAEENNDHDGPSIIFKVAPATTPDPNKKGKK